MRYASAPPFRQALEARLGSASRAGGPSLARLRKEVVFDRLLARLVAVAPRRQTSTTDLYVPVRLPLAIALTGVAR